MRNIALRLSYDGSAYHGWQVQKNEISVAETLESALTKICGHPVKTVGCGRTDAGVHALRYCANFRTDCRIPIERFPLAVNSRLPGDISVSDAVEAEAGFNAIGSCLKKEYVYKILNSPIPDPFLQKRVCFYPQRLDLELMQRAASAFEGTHDFRAVRSLGTETRTTVRTVYWCRAEKEGNLICTTCAGPWWAPWSTPPTESSCRKRSRNCWKRETGGSPDRPCRPRDCTSTDCGMRGRWGK